MNYYRRYSGDYLRDTARLTLTEHGAYCLLLDYYYSEERPLPIDKDELFLMVRAMRPEDRRAVDKVLSLYFTKEHDGYHQKRADHEIGVSKKARGNGGKGGRPPAQQDTGTITGSETGLVTETQTEGETGTETGAVSETITGSGHPPTTNHQPPTTTLQPPAANPHPAVPPLRSGTSGNAKTVGAAAHAASPRKRPERNPATESKTGPAWNAYASAYRGRYGVEPLRNAKVNAQFAQLLTRVPESEAPDIAAFFVSSSRGLYVAAKHAVDLLLRDCEGIRTEWVTGRSGTDTEARQADRTQAIGNAFAPLIAEAQAREASHGGE